MPPSAARRAVLAICVALILGVTAGPGWLRSADAVGSIPIAGRVRGLVPGVPRTLRLVIRNPYGFPIVMRSIAVIVGDASRRCSRRDVVSPGLTEPLRVPASSRIAVRVPIKLRRATVDACQGVSYPLTFRGRAVRP
jgi:hypothetical protein